MLVNISYQGFPAKAPPWNGDFDVEEEKARFSPNLNRPFVASVLTLNDARSNSLAIKAPLSLK